MILYLTPNPAVDQTMYVDEIHLDEVHRSKKVLTVAGGKGLNVARTIRTLGGDPLCIGPIGGHAGNLLAELAEQEGLGASWTRMQNETRTCIILVQEKQDATVVNEPGQEVTVSECDTLIDDVCQQALHTKFICVCGSLPPGFSQTQYKFMLSKLVAMDKQVWVDTSGDALKTALEVKGVCIKVNAAELGHALDIKIPNIEQASKTAWQLLEDGISKVAVTLGKDGAVLCSEVGAWKATPPTIELVSSVGSGDAFLGGLLFALEDGASADVALRSAVAAGAANALEFGGGRLSLNTFVALRDEVINIIVDSSCKCH
jgi:tagatose 6-phosphate kinase